MNALPPLWPRLLAVVIALLMVGGCQRRFPDPGEPIAPKTGWMLTP